MRKEEKKEKTNEWYLQKVMDLLEISPWENQFQNLLVYPVLEEALSGGMKVVDCHNFRQYNTKRHARNQYSVLAKAVPDLLIAKNFVYYNRIIDGGENKIITPNDQEIVAAIEVKAPNSEEMCNRSLDGSKEYSKALYLEIFSSLYKNKKVILTNARRWEFFEWKGIDDDLKSRLDEYISILELCAGDDGNDGVEKQEIEHKIREKKELKEEEKDKIWKFLSGIFKEKKISVINKKNLITIVNSVDHTYFEDIKKCIKSTKICSIDIISNNCELMVDRYDNPPIQEGKKIKSIADFKLGKHELADLYRQLDSFII